MSDDLVKRLNDLVEDLGEGRACWGHEFIDAAVDAMERIEELEAFLAKTAEALQVIEDASRFFARDRESSDTETLSYTQETTRRLCSTTLAEITKERSDEKGEK